MNVSLSRGAAAAAAVQPSEDALLREMINGTWQLSGEPSGEFGYAISIHVDNKGVLTGGGHVFNKDFEFLGKQDGQLLTFTQGWPSLDDSADALFEVTVDAGGQTFGGAWHRPNDPSSREHAHGS